MKAMTPEDDSSGTILTHCNPVDPVSQFNIGDEIEVYVMKIDIESKKIALVKGKVEGFVYFAFYLSKLLPKLLINHILNQNLCC